MKEPEMKLFGRKIVLPTDNAGEEFSDGGSGGAVDCEVSGEKADDEKHLPDEEDEVETKTQIQGAAEEPQNPTLSSELDENPKTPSIEDVDNKNEQSEATNGKQKQLKKPDKILPCPRCNSMDTKFCYYNNYNVNQPRHFCKSCQRYWTAGGTMRNVPVGAGRRKNKNSHCRHITISEALQTAQIDPPNGFHSHPAFKPNGTVLSFGPDESMPLSASLSSCKKGECMDDNSIESSITTTSSVQKRDEDCEKRAVIPNYNGVPYPVPCIPGVAWPFPVPMICPPGYPMPFYPNPYWNCGVPNAWNVVPWGPGKGSGPNSPLGKHSRNGELIKANGSGGQEDMDPKNSECSIVVPKTLRSDDPEEAAKSSIWEALGIKHDRVSRKGLFQALQPKSDEKKGIVSTSSVLHANPAALSRSINFQESA